MIFPIDSHFQMKRLSERVEKVRQQQSAEQNMRNLLMKIWIKFELIRSAKTPKSWQFELIRYTKKLNNLY